jgi:FlaA1/EpsC-like NDP-sugar epimerase
MDLASQMISFMGEGRNIDIVYTGLRPGEKVHEKLMAISESCEPSDHPMISRLQTARANDEILASLPQLFDYAMNREREDLVSLMKQLTDSYSPFDLSRTGGLEDGCDTARATGPARVIQAGVSYNWGRESAGGNLNA